MRQVVWIGLLFFLAETLAAQPAEKSFVFEAASIKPADPQTRGTHWNTTPGRITAKNLTLKGYVMIAYDLKQYQISGCPNWGDSDRYDITAKLEATGERPPRGKEADEQILAALQKLLAERFKLEIHRETKTMPAYALVVAKKGFKLKEVEAGGGSSTSTNRGKMTAKRTSMERLASILSRQMDQPVANLTGIEGVFDFTLEWSPDDGREALDKAPGGETAPAGPSIFTALQEQLGLRLEARKAPIEIIAIDRAEKPVEN